ncbi:hypothetical protein [Nostoc sp. NMS8]|nr:hypothetical protein [Nostoc sp. NMS8]MBN3958344.1 hypothetical protein [Nostoc sp. NMS8]
MSSKIRKQIYIEPRQEHLLKAIAQQAGVSEAEIRLFAKLLIFILVK